MYFDLSDYMDYPTAFKLATFWRTAFGSAVEKIAVAGSIRRRKSAGIKDVELVVVPRITASAAQLDLFGNVVATAPVNWLDDKLASLQSFRLIVKRAGTTSTARWGERLKTFYVARQPGATIDALTTLIQVDLFVVLPPAQWGAIMVIRTGPGEFSQKLMEYINRFTPYRQVDGRLIDAAGNDVETPDEADYFAALDLPYIDPPDRTVARLRQIVNERRQRRRQV